LVRQHGMVIGASGIPAEALRSEPVRRAVLLVAGTGHRLMPLTAEIPKCLIKVAGEAIIERALRVLASQGIKEAVIVIGHGGKAVRACLGTTFAGVALTYIEAPDYATTNNICSLWHARETLNEDLLLVEGDLVFDAEVIAALLATPGSSAAVVSVDRVPRGSKVRVDDTNKIGQFILEADGLHLDGKGIHKTANIYLLRRGLLVDHVVPRLSRAITERHIDRYYESVFRDLVEDGSVTQFAAVDVSNRRWWEIDDQSDLDVAEFEFASRNEQYDRLKRLHGGFWRYGVIDHSYMSNMYFPDLDLLADLKAKAASIVTNYPVGQEELARLAAEWTGASPDQLAIANGSCELIRILCRDSIRRITVPTPTFNEYEAVVAGSETNKFPVHPQTFELDVDAFVQSAIAWQSDAAIVVSPNNPTGLSVPRKKILDAARTLSAHRCRLVVDESFVEFSRAGRAQSVEHAVKDHANLIVIKSMSKVFGIPGLRLGYLLSADLALVGRVRTLLPVWNVNGFAAEFLRIVKLYRDAFEQSCDLTRSSTRQLEAALSELSALTPIRSDANFILCRIADGAASASEIARSVYLAHKILIKDCSTKTMPNSDRYLRIAVRTPGENQRLVLALASVL
jgi:histidinol-phosphate/aromatic aminotransferase/cobyric acid decarboxylase-like protein/choline kinase